ncbi:hypothetical protein B0G73_103376 [Paraburkholderia sp. BL25I1N1]|nr:hypothetical protein B0G73_103376 [Paraburkholderia sp. BL25I1N1]
MIWASHGTNSSRSQITAICAPIDGSKTTSSNFPSFKLANQRCLESGFNQESVSEKLVAQVTQHSIASDENCFTVDLSIRLTTFCNTKSSARNALTPNNSTAQDCPATRDKPTLHTEVPRSMLMDTISASCKETSREETSLIVIFGPSFWLPQTMNRDRVSAGRIAILLPPPVMPVWHRCIRSMMPVPVNIPIGPSVGAITSLLVAAGIHMN